MKTRSIILITVLLVIGWVIIKGFPELWFMWTHMK